MEIEELMRLERQKSVIKALAELEIALNTFYNNDPNYDGLESLYKQLKEYKEGYLY
ncbi:hypothetical protein [Bacillus infantis]|uniref:hypothetical protein n=1 Tax=Bacillus infantis TaxID=324767 RepID=UPI003CEADB0A